MIHSTCQTWPAQTSFLMLVLGESQPQTAPMIENHFISSYSNIHKCHYSFSCHCSFDEPPSDRSREKENRCRRIPGSGLPASSTLFNLPPFPHVL